MLPRRLALPHNLSPSIQTSDSYFQMMTLPQMNDPDLLARQINDHQWLLHFLIINDPSLLVIPHRRQSLIINAPSFLTLRLCGAISCPINQSSITT